MKNTREQDLAAALLWLRNHYDVENEPGETEILKKIKAEVLRRVDKVLADGPELSIQQQAAFRARYPKK